MVIVSSGFHRTHVTIAAHEAAVRNNLRIAITGAYPTMGLRRGLSSTRLSRGRIARLLERDEAIPSAQLRPLFTPELLDEAVRLMRRVPAASSRHAGLSAACMRLYGALAGRELARVAKRRDVYHFRAGFGHASIKRARALGAIALCDHAAVHPALRTVGSSADSAVQAQPGASSETRDPIGQAILFDIEAADAIVVNSDLLRDMFVDLGYPGDRVHVVYLGIDEAFLTHARESAGQMRRLAPLRLMFAGRFDTAKGAHVLIDALSQVRADWELVIAGPVDPSIRRDRSSFFSDPRVILRGTIDRRSLADDMSIAPVFVFPSLSEGSARVVFEALACGCFVITTPSAGSIVEDGVNGSIVGPGSADELARAITAAESNPDRLLEVGQRNAGLIAEDFTQAEYGDRLASLYRRLVAEVEEVQPSRSAQRSTFFAPNSG